MNRQRGGEKVFLGLGSNLGDRSLRLEQGLAGLAEGGVGLVRVSSIYDTDPVGMPEQGAFLNLVLEASWPGPIRDLLALCLRLEREAGRVRRLPQGPRTLDIDILLVGDRVIREPGLEIPHPRAHLRRFVLVPLAEIAASKVHPVLERTVAELLAECRDPAGVREWGPPPTLAGVPPSGYNPSASRDRE